jgi:hypothetical protein
MFDKYAPTENITYRNTQAEAIVDRLPNSNESVSKGFWIDKTYLDTTSFHSALETALHELSHKAGGDETAEFSYKLTKVNSLAIGQLLEDIKSRNEIQALAKLWDEATIF